MRPSFDKLGYGVGSHERQFVEKRGSRKHLGSSFDTRGYSDFNTFAAA
jgi:hypothetical protein